MNAFENAIAKTPFAGFFEPIRDLCYFSWEPDDLTYKTLDDVTSEEIKDNIVPDVQPPKLIDISSISLPKMFLSLPSREYANKYPFGQTAAASLFVAIQHCGVSIDSLDFFMGGSAINMLAAKSTDGKKFFATKIPESNVIVLAKRHEYVNDYAAPGYQFERLVTGGCMNMVPAEMRSIEHIHLMKVAGKYRVLFSAEVDAIDNEGIVEVTCSNSRYWGNSLFFQCISNASHAVCHGEKFKGRLEKITLVSLDKLSDKMQDIRTLKSNIEDCLRELALQMQSKGPGVDFEVKFECNRLQLVESCEQSNVLPPDIVMWQLLD